MDFVCDPNLVLYLPLSEVDGAAFASRDAYGHLCAVTGALWTPQGRSFDGVDDFITPPTSVPACLKPTTALTFEAFLKITSSAGFQYIGAYRLGGIRFYLAGGNPGIELYTSTPGDHGCVWASSIADGSWHHFLAAYDTSLSTQNLNLYIDTVLRATSNWTEPVNYGTGYWAIGRCGNDSSGYFSGLLGEVRLYSRALTPLEAMHNYLATKWRYK